MRSALAALAAGASILVLGGCASDVVSGAEEARNSAASLGSDLRSSASSVGAGSRQACQRSGPQLTQLDSLAGRLAAEPGTRRALAPEVRATVDKLGTAIGDRTELQPVVAAGRDLTEAIGDANESAVVLAARQAQVAVRSAQAVCKLAG
jgi:translation initiation factor 2 gamma subunit (eIF-2gamma)